MQILSVNANYVSFRKKDYERNKNQVVSMMFIRVVGACLFFMNKLYGHKFLALWSERPDLFRFYAFVHKNQILGNVKRFRGFDFTSPLGVIY